MIFVSFQSTISFDSRLKCKQNKTNTPKIDQMIHHWSYVIGGLEGGEDVIR